MVADWEYCGTPVCLLSLVLEALRTHVHLRGLNLRGLRVVGGMLKRNRRSVGFVAVLNELRLGCGLSVLAASLTVTMVSDVETGNVTDHGVYHIDMYFSAVQGRKGSAKRKGINTSEIRSHPALCLGSLQCERECC